MTWAATAKNTLMDLAAETGPDGDLMKMAMVLEESNEILQDATWFEANGPTFHKFVQSLSLPAGTWRLINRGVPIEAAHGTPATEELGMLESFAHVDKKLVDLAPNPVEFRSNKIMQFLEGMNQTFAASLIYGNNEAAPEQITGLAPRLNDTALSNVTSMGSTSAGGDLSSIYFVQWGEGKTWLAYPRAAESLGVSHKDNGELTLEDDDGYKFRGYEDHFMLDVGLVVEDPRTIARLCNIETAGATNILAIDSKIMGIIRRMPGKGRGAVLYMNETILTQLDVLSYGKTSPITYGPDGDVFGELVTWFRGHPVRLVEQILDTEALVTT